MILLSIALHILCLTYVCVGSDVTETARGHGQIGIYSFMDMASCGLIKPNNATKVRIIDGELAKEGEFPWMASIHYTDPKANDSFLCGGALIHKNWVLTVAHCLKNVKDVSLMKVYLGSVDKYRYHTYFDVFDFYLHPRWDLHPKSDLALIRIKPDTFSQSVTDHFIINYICLPKSLTLNDKEEMAIVSGFGYIDTKATIPSLQLRKTLVDIKSSYECLKQNYPVELICGPEANHMTCFGDSGSPLVQFDQNRAVLIGIVGGGKTMTTDICGPGIMYYLRVSKFIDWISTTIGINLRASPAEQTINNGISFSQNSFISLLIIIIILLRKLFSI